MKTFFSLLLCLVTAPLIAQTPDPRSTATPWPSQYKILPWEIERLTDADVVGPDGVVYPDFRYAGVSGGIPDIHDATIRSGYKVFDVTSSTYGAMPNDEKVDDASVSKALADALVNSESGGKSILFFPPGVFDLSVPLVINKNHVVIQGKGRAVTKLRIGPGGKAGSALLTFTPEDGTPTDFTPWAGQYLAATSNIQRGADTAVFDQDAVAKGYAVGDWVRIQPTKAGAGSTMRVRYSKPENHVEYTDAAGHFGRTFFARITAIDSPAKQVTFDRTFPHDYFANEVPQMRKGQMLEGCGIQDLTIETTNAQSAMDPISFTQVAESWVSDVHFLKPANWPYLLSSVARREFRRCHFDGTWAPITSGSRSYLALGNMDLLMQGCRANDMRHMPVFQQSMRCVVSDCIFTGDTVQSP